MADYRTGRSDYSGGSVWRRWDPHIHTPGTLFNDGFPPGDEGWEAYLVAIEAAAPAVQALGITDYFGVGAYEEFLVRAQGRLPSVDLVFPNIELRLNTGTGKSAINLHLLVSPHDPDHVPLIKQFLKGLTFVSGTTLHCDPDDLRALGRQHKPNLRDPKALLAEGANQFKVDFEQLRTAWKRNAWVQDNVLVAVAASSNDGMAGLGRDASFATLRAEIESFAHFMFTATPSQRAFWLGQTDRISRAELDARYNGRKACIHGCDAHQLDRVLEPAEDRRCWIKGDATFESLRQAALEPEDRVFIGPAPPEHGLPSQIIAQVDVSDAGWLPNSTLSLNGRLVCVIGARGSGKTALADLVAAGAYAAPGQVNERSFLHRAKPKLRDERVRLTWADGETTDAGLRDAEHFDVVEWPRAQYLSQQFVDRLCAADGVTTELMGEIHRVIFQTHSLDDRLGATDFEELLEMRCARATAAHERQTEALDTLSEEIRQERDRAASLQRLRAQREGHLTNAGKLKNDRTALIPQGDADRAARFEALSRAVEAKQQALEQAERRRQAILALAEEVRAFRTVTAAVQLRQLRAKHSEAGLSDAAWARFRLEYDGDVDEALSTAKTDVEAQITALRGRTPTGEGPFVADDADLSTPSLAVLQAEHARIQALVGVDKDKAKRYSQLSQQIGVDEAAAARLDREIAAAEGASARIATLIADRNTAYQAVMAALAEQQAELESLYAPLKARLVGEEGALAKLAFEVRRTADIERWAKEGETLIDTRKAGAFRGNGKLAELATAQLKTIWETGTPEAIAAAMSRFLETYRDDFRLQSIQDPADREAYRRWASDLSRWFYSVDHINIAYGVQYDQTEIDQLSPGTRGIVLLLLYLAVDHEDLRPLIIDQPEENLDPKSIFDELVPRFRAAKLRRQVIIVTHNANLVVNADADQVIVATCGSHQPDALPAITYRAGSLENPVIRQQVCDILEGGTDAFKERARRLRVRLPGESEV